MMMFIDRILHEQKPAACLLALCLGACVSTAEADPGKIIAEGGCGWTILGSLGNLATSVSYSANSVMGEGLSFGESTNRAYLNEGGFFIRHDAWRTIFRNDFDGDGRTDAWYYDANGGMWYFILSSSADSAVYSLKLGGPDAQACPEDYDGDGRADPCVYRRSSGRWETMLSAHGYVSQTCFGPQKGLPASGDYDGDGYADFAAFVPETQSWTVLFSRQLYAAATFSFGDSGDVPAPADFDGDGLTDYALYQSQTALWKIILSSEHYAGVYSFNLGGRDRLPVQGDYDGDLKADPAVYGLYDGIWQVLLSGNAYQYGAIFFCPAGGLPYPGDYDNDGKFDPAVMPFDLSRLYLLKSTEGADTIPSK